MKITDGKKTADVKMMTWTGSGYSPDWSLDFFSAVALAYCEDTNVFTVDDVDSCIEQAMDWRDSKGDFQDDEPNEDNAVFVEFL